MPRPAGIPDVQWRDWVWQMQERVRSAKDLERYVNPTDDERQAIDALAERFRFVITPYYASLMDPDDPACPIRKQEIPPTQSQTSFGSG
jgi:lysine 2,3-aminomutase